MGMAEAIAVSVEIVSMLSLSRSFSPLAVKSYILSSRWGLMGCSSYEASLSCPCPFGLSGLAVFAEGDSSGSQFGRYRAF